MIHGKSEGPAHQQPTRIPVRRFMERDENAEFEYIEVTMAKCIQEPVVDDLAGFPHALIILSPGAET